MYIPLKWFVASAGGGIFSYTQQENETKIFL